jgi:hypothetical protein
MIVTGMDDCGIQIGGQGSEGGRQGAKQWSGRDMPRRLRDFTEPFRKNALVKAQKAI